MTTMTELQLSKRRRLWFGVVVLVLSACAETSDDELVPRASIQLDLNDPSGLTLIGQNLWVVSDSKKKAYEFTPGGAEVRQISIDGSDFDGFEAVAAQGDAVLLAVEETGEIIRAELSTGDVVDRIQVADVSTGNSGLEGLFVRDDGHILALKEKDPSQLIHLSANCIEITRTELDFAPDVSGLTGLGETDCPEQLLVVSQESRTVYQITDDGDVLDEWPIDAKRPEGIAFDDGSLYIVDEDTEELLVFNFEGGCL